MDEDITAMGRQQLIAEVLRLREELKAAREANKLLRLDVHLQQQIVRAEMDLDFDRSRELFLKLKATRRERKKLEADSTHKTCEECQGSGQQRVENKFGEGYTVRCPRCYGNVPREVKHGG